MSKMTAPLSNLRFLVTGTLKMVVLFLLQLVVKCDTTEVLFEKV